MAANEIRIIIGGDPAGLVNASKQSTNALGNLQKSVGATQAALSKSIAGTNQAGQALTNLGRIAQDAPFGFIGIQNNINPLLESFQRLKAETGSTGKALKALGSSLIGAGGLGLAISLATSALTFFSMSGFGATESLKGLDKAMADANQEAGEQISKLKVLAEIAANTNNSLKDRKDATEQLQKALKANNVELSQEKILNNEAAAAINTATQAILARAKATAISARLAQLETGNLDRDLKREGLINRLTVAQKQYNKELAEEQARLKNTGETARGNIELATEILGLKQTIGELTDETGKANVEIDALLKRVTQAPTTAGGKDVVVDILKRRIAALKELQSIAGLTQKQQVELTGLEITLAKRDAAGFTPKELQEKIDGIIENAFPDKNFVFEVSPTIKFIPDESGKRPAENLAALLGLDQITDADIEKAVDPIRRAAKASAEAIKEAMSKINLSELNENLTRVLQDGLGSAITAAGEGLGKLIVAGGGAKELFGSLFNVISHALTELGKSLIAYGVAMLAFKIAIKTLNPAAAIIGGFGLILAASVLRNAIKIPGFAGGVTNFGGGFAVVGEKGPELVRLPRGSDVIPNHMLAAGGSLNVTLMPSMRFSGKDFFVTLQRISESNSRMGGGRL